MAVVFALPRLFDAVVAQFAADGTLAEQTFGWLAPAEQVRTNARITWTPGDKNGVLGAFGPPKYNGMPARQIATLFELCTVEIYAFDPAQRTVERSQYQIVRELFDAWLRAVDLAAAGTYLIVGSEWVGGDRTRRSGASLLVVFSVQAPIVDEPTATATAPADTGAEIEVHELEATDVIVIPPPVV